MIANQRPSFKLVNIKHTKYFGQNQSPIIYPVGDDYWKSTVQLQKKSIKRRIKVNILILDKIPIQKTS